MDRKLNFNDHVTMYVTKTRGILGYIKGWPRVFDSFITKKLFVSLVSPIFNMDRWYGIIIHSDHIERVQKEL